MLNSFQYQDDGDLSIRMTEILVSGDDGLYPSCNDIYVIIHIIAFLSVIMSSVIKL